MYVGVQICDRKDVSSPFVAGKTQLAGILAETQPIDDGLRPAASDLRYVRLGSGIPYPYDCPLHAFH